MDMCVCVCDGAWYFVPISYANTDVDVLAQLNDDGDDDNESNGLLTFSRQ